MLQVLRAGPPSYTPQKATFHTVRTPSCCSTGSSVYHQLEKKTSLRHSTCQMPSLYKVSARELPPISMCKYSSLLPSFGSLWMDKIILAIRIIQITANSICKQLTRATKLRFPIPLLYNLCLDSLPATVS